MRRLLTRSLIAALLLGAGGRSASSEPPVQVGYVTLGPDSATAAPAGAALFSYINDNGVLISQAGVGATEPIRSGLSFIDQSGAQMGFALANPSGQDASVMLTLRNAAGAEAARRTLTLRAGAQLAKYVSELFPVQSENFVGSLSFDST